MAENYAAKSEKELKAQYKKAEKIKHHYFRAFYYAFAITFILGGLAAVFFFVYQQDKNFFGFSDKYFAKAEEYLDGGDSTNAEKALIDCLEFDPEYKKAREALVSMYEEQGRTEEAISLLQDGLEIQPRYVSYYQNIIRLYTSINKITEAMDFMSGISSSYIIVQLSEIRPSNIIMSPDPGTYDTAVTVSFTTAENTVIYYTLDGSKPNENSLVYDPANKPVIDKGTVTVSAFALDTSTGLISDLSTSTYRIYSENSEYVFLDAKVEQMFRSAIQKNSGTIYYRDLESVKRLSNVAKGDTVYTGSITTLDDLKNMKNLTEVVIYDEPGITDYSALKELKSLSSLTLSGCEIDDTAAAEIYSIIWINSLNLDNNYLSSLSRIKNMSVLRELSISGNSVTDISPLSGLNNLKSVNISDNLISDISSLEYLTSLTKLDISSNLVTDLSAISSLKTLTELDVSSNVIETLSPIKRLTNIEYLDLSDNIGIKYLSAISDFSHLTNLKIAGTSVKDLSDISSMTSIETLDCSRTAITSWEGLSHMNVKTLIASSCNIYNASVFCLASSLQALDLSGNQISDPSPFASLGSLSVLNLSLNPITDLSPLALCENLVTLYCSGISVTATEMSTLQLKGIMVIQ